MKEACQKCTIFQYKQWRLMTKALLSIAAFKIAIWRIWDKEECMCVCETVTCFQHCITRIYFCSNWALFSLRNKSEVVRFEGIITKCRGWAVAQTLAACTTEERTGTLKFMPGGFAPEVRTSSSHWIEGYVNPRAGLDAMARSKNLLTYRESNSGRPARSLVNTCRTVHSHATSWCGNSR
jgi:hypothetical protein